MDGPWMLADGGFGDDLAGLLAETPAGLSGRELAARLHRRRGDVSAVLRADPRFEHCGNGRGSRWRPSVWLPLKGPWGTMGTEGRGSPDPEPIPEEVGA
jgi:hypothetical protein